jgi:hypothetical protein
MHYMTKPRSVFDMPNDAIIPWRRIYGGPHGLLLLFSSLCATCRRTSIMLVVIVVVIQHGTPQAHEEEKNYQFYAPR